MNHPNRAQLCRAGATCLAIAVTCAACVASAQQAPPPRRPLLNSVLKRVIERAPEIVVEREPPQPAQPQQPVTQQDLRALEEYYDELEDFYEDRDPQLAKHYERMEEYYEDVRKGRRAFVPPTAAPGFPLPMDAEWQQPPLAGPALSGEATPPAEPQPGASGVPTRSVASIVAPDARLQQVYQNLRRELQRVTGGDKWLDYLNLPFAADGRPTSVDSLLTPASRDALEEALERYDRVAGDPQYRALSELPEFGQTRGALRSLVSWLGEQPTLATPALPPQVEELPLPAPAVDASPQE